MLSYIVWSLGVGGGGGGRREIFSNYLEDGFFGVKIPFYYEYERIFMNSAANASVFLCFFAPSTKSISPEYFKKMLKKNLI